MRYFSVAQCLGYLAFILGVSGFVQKRDHRLKALIAGESGVYALHFFLLGNLAASASALISGGRTLLSLKTRLLAVALLIIAINVVVGFEVTHGRAQWLPVIASCAGTVALFRMHGVPMRLVLLGCTFLWLANNILSGSIGGTLLETTIAIANISTVVRMVQAPVASSNSGVMVAIDNSE